MTSIEACSQITADNPWPGLSAYGEADSHFFWGRRREIDTLFRMVQRETLTVVFGPSGVGKTSLLNAGVFPKLRDACFLPVGIRLDHTATANLIEQTRDAVAAAARSRDIILEPFSEPLATDAETLWEYLHRMEFWDRHNQPITPVLIFDQFEELFTLGKPPVEEQFISELADLVENNIPRTVQTRLTDTGKKLEYDPSCSHYKIVLSLREEFVARLDRHRSSMPLVMHNRLPLSAMNGEQAMEAVLGPGGHLIDAPLAEQIVRFVAAEKPQEPRLGLKYLFVEPAYLSVFCQELNIARHQQDRITPDLLERNRDSILIDFYERSVADISPSARIFIEENLLTASGYRDSIAVEDALLKGLSLEELSLLEKRRLLRREDRMNVPRIELVHDRLTGVVKARRNARILEEAGQKEALERQAMLDSARALKNRRNFYASIAIIFVVTTLCAGWMWYLADQNEKKAVEASNLAISEAKNAQTIQSNINYLQGIEMIEKGETSKALASLAMAIRNHPDKQHKYAAARIANLFIQRVFALPLTKPLQHEDWVNSASFSPDGTKIVTASRDKTARVWDAATGKPLNKPLQHEDWVNSAVFSPDSSKIVTASRDKTARVWDAATGELLNKPLQHEGWVNSAVFSPDGSKIVTASGDKTARVWDAATGESLNEPLQHDNWVNSAVFSPDNSKIVTASVDNIARNTARVWDAATGKPLTEPLKHGSCVNSAVFSPDSSRIVTTSSDKNARVWDAATGNPVTEPLQHRGDVYSAVFSTDGTKIVTASEDNTARVWDAATGKPLTEHLLHRYWVNSAVFSTDGDRIVTASADYTAQMWDAATVKPSAESMIQHEKNVYLATFSPDGTKIVTASEDNTARVWDAATGKPLTEEPVQHGGPVYSAVFSSDNTKIVTASEDKTARVWDADTGKPLTEEPIQHGGPVYSAVFSSDNTKIVTASEDKTARVWDADTGKPLTAPMQHEYGVTSALFSPDGSKIITAPADNTTRVWDAAAGSPLTEPMQHRRRVTSACFSPDGSKIATASEDNTARVWDAATGNPLTEPMQHENCVNAAIFSPDGSSIITASSDNTTRVWDAATGIPLTDSFKHESWINAACFSPDGARIVTASGDMTARVWPIAPASTVPIPVWLPLLAEAVAGYRINDQNVQEPVEHDKILKFREDFRNSKEKDPYSQIARWFFADMATRPISPYNPDLPEK
jgi:WD40 repeat protein